MSNRLKYVLAFLLTLAITVVFIFLFLTAWVPAPFVWLLTGKNLYDDYLFNFYDTIFVLLDRYEIK